MTYNVKVLSPANVVEVEEEVPVDELHDAVTRHTEDFIDTFPGYTLEITANL